MRSLVCAAAVIGGVLGIAGSADAAIYTISYEGVVSSGRDYGAFGVNGDLAGQQYSAAYTIDTLTPGATRIASWFLVGNGTASPMQATLTINAITLSFVGGEAEVIEADVMSRAGYDSISDSVAGAVVCGGDIDCLGGPVVNGRVAHHSGIRSRDIVDGDVDTAPGNLRYALGDFVSATGFSITTAGPNGQATLASGTFAPERLVTSASAPEPTTWALMIVGFGLTGGLLRRRPSREFRAEFGGHRTT